MPQVVGVALHIQCGSPANCNRVVQQGLKGYCNLLPSQLATGSLKDTPARLLQPIGCNIMTAKRARVATIFQPCNINQQPFRQGSLELV